MLLVEPDLGGKKDLRKRGGGVNKSLKYEPPAQFTHG